MENIENFTIPPELFYPKSSSDSIKRKIASIVPNVIKKKFNVVKGFVRGNRNRAMRKKQNSPNRPQLGTINKKYLRQIKLAKKKKKLNDSQTAAKIPKQTKVNLENSRINESTTTMVTNLDVTTVERAPALQDISNKNNSMIKPAPQIISFPMTPKPILIQHIEDDENDPVDPFFAPVKEEKKPRVGGSFKFFKSKNTRSDESAESSDEDLFGASEKPDIESPADVKVEPKLDVSASDFKDDHIHEFGTSTQNIESLLDQLENGETCYNVEEGFNIQPKDVQNSTTLQNVIDVLEGTDDKVEKEPEEVKGPEATTSESTQTDQDQKENTLDNNDDDEPQAKIQKLDNNSEPVQTIPAPTAENLPTGNEASADKPQKSFLGKLKDRFTQKYLGFGSSQLQIDAGQKKFGITECKECGFNYNTNVPEDEKIHATHHESLMKIPRFKGWANEIAYTITGIGKEDDSRVIYLEPNHKNIASNYVRDLLTNMEKTLGVPFETPENYHLYIAVIDSKMVGLCAVEEDVQAVLLDSPNDTLIPVRLGVQRLFVRSEFRRKGIAKTLLKSITMKHFKGEMIELATDVAFSSPSEDGHKLLNSLISSDRFYVY